MASLLTSEVDGLNQLSKLIQPIEDALESIPTFTFLDGRGTPLAAPLEWQTGFVEFSIEPALWEFARFWCNGEEIQVSLQRLAGKKRVLAPWPLSGPGSYQLRLLVGDVEDKHVVTVPPRKITKQGFMDLLWHLEARLPASIALGLQRCGGLAGVEIIPPQETTRNEELLRLRLAVQGDAAQPGLAQLLPLIAQDPHHVLQATEHWVRHEQARRPHPTRLVQSLIRGSNLASDGLPERIIDSRVEHALDVYENRVVQAFVTEVNLRLRRLRDVSGSGSAIGIECEALLRKLAIARRLASFLDAVSVPQFLPTQPTMVLLKRPAYRAALQGYVRLHRSAVIRLEEPDLSAPLENLPSLYQTWGTLEVIDALLVEAAEAGFHVIKSELLQRDQAGFFVKLLPDGRPALVLTHPETHVVVRLTPERNFSGKHNRSGVHSISFDQRPDVTVEVEVPGEAPRLYLFDPKYKLDGEGTSGAEVAESAASSESGTISGRPKKVDIDKMHAYRDAIRGADGERVVLYAAILYPGQEECYGDGIAALRAVPDDVGALQSALRSVLKGILQT